MQLAFGQVFLASDNHIFKKRLPEGQPISKVNFVDCDWMPNLSFCFIITARPRMTASEFVTFYCFSHQIKAKENHFQLTDKAGQTTQRCPSHLSIFYNKTGKRHSWSVPSKRYVTLAQCLWSISQKKLNWWIRRKLCDWHWHITMINDHLVNQPGNL